MEISRQEPLAQPGEKGSPMESLTSADMKNFTNPSKFVNIQDIVEPPTMTPNLLTYDWKKLLNVISPYLLNRIKMWGPHVICPLNLYQLLKIKKENMTSQPTTSKISRPPLTRLDFLTHWIQTLNPVVMQDLYRILSLFSVSLPLVIPWSEDDEDDADAREQNPEQRLKFKVLIPLLRNCIYKWSRPDRDNLVVENQLFVSKYKIIAAIRVGSGDVGKSSILGRILKDDYAFSSCEEPGGQFGPPKSLAGTIEIIPLTEETCSASFWEIVAAEHYFNNNNDEDEILLLANLHGDALDNKFRGHLNFLKGLGATFVIFQMPNLPQEAAEEFELKFSQSSKFFKIFIDPDEDTLESMEDISLSTKRLTRDYNIEKLREVFRAAIKQSKSQPVEAMQTLELCQDEDLDFSIVPDISTDCSTALVNEIKYLGCPVTKGLLSLQKHPPNADTAAHLTTLLEEISLTDEVNGQFRYTPLQKVLNSFLNILFLPIDSRYKSLVHLDSSVSKLSLDETSLSRQQLMINRRALQIASNVEATSAEEIHRLRQTVASSYREIDQRTLGIEHFFREVSTLYEGLMMTDDLDNISKKYLSSPEKVAELLLDGQPIEIFDGDEGTMSRCWFSSVMTHVSRINPKKEKLRVFVVSILGLQSSGKSTLLNSLFNCKFAVSAGRCTKGLFLRLLFLEPAYATKLNFDALLLIDTEGLGSPEKKNDPVSDERDRKMATFAVSISNFTIINVLGETLSPISDILQIVIVVLGRLRTAGLTPDIMVVQHTSEKNVLNRAAAIDEFRHSLVKAIEVVTKEPIKYRQSNVEAIRFLEKSLNAEDLVEEFPSFKGGAGVGAPPTKEYHEHVVNLFSKIMKRGKGGLNTFSFNLWQERVYDTWQSIKDENFAVRFKDIVDMQEFHRRGERIAETQEKVMIALTDHVERIKTQLVQLVDEPLSDVGGVVAKSDKKDEIIGQVVKYMGRCNQKSETDQEDQLNSTATGCAKCLAANDSLCNLQKEASGKSYERQIAETMEKHQQQCIQDARNSLLSFYEAVEIERKRSSVIGQKITNHLKALLGENQTTGVPDEITRVRYANQIFQSLERDFENQKDPYFRNHIFTEISEKVAPVIVASLVNESFNQPWSRFQLSTYDIFEKVKVKPGWLTRVQHGNFHFQFLTEDQKSDLITKFQQLPWTLLNRKNLTHYVKNRGLATALVKMLDQVITNFQDQWGNFKEIYAVQEIAVRIFLETMYEFEEIFLMKNSPLAKFRDQEHFYRQQIDTILTHGFSANTAGQLCGDRLIQSVTAQAKSEAEKQHREQIMSLSWFSGVENLRLSYFTEMARQVQRKDYHWAIRHFGNPENCLLSWTTEKIDSFPGEKRQSDFTSYLASEIRSLVIKIRNCKSIDELLQLEKQHFQKSRLERAHIELTANEENFDIFHQKVLEKLEEFTTQVQETRVTFMKPSTDPLVLQRFGCTSACHFCGAICWGVKGHELREDDTKCHHTSHQPQGLARVHCRNTRSLRFKVCHDESLDTHTYFWGEFRETGLSWPETKVHPQKNDWLYTRHNNSNFDALMVWFFVHMHEKLAEAWELEPAPAEEVQALRKTLPDLNSIINQLEARIGQSPSRVARTKFSDFFNPFRRGFRTSDSDDD